jgi:prepilin-type N-terminal cleavage/methylation domain-containing protein
MPLLVSNPQPPVSSPPGFTLLELLIVIVLLGILGGIVALQFPPLLARTRLAAAARQVATDLQLVRMRAIAQNHRFRITFRAGTEDYVVERDEAEGWQPHVLHGHGRETEGDGRLVLPQGVVIEMVNSGGDVIFVPRGHVDGGITVTLGVDTIAEAKRVIVNLAGRVRIE